MWINIVLDRTDHYSLRVQLLWMKQSEVRHFSTDVSLSFDNDDTIIGDQGISIALRSKFDQTEPNGTVFYQVMNIDQRLQIKN